MRVGVVATVTGVSSAFAGLLAVSPGAGVTVFLGAPTIVGAFALVWTVIVLRHGRITGTLPSIRGVLSYAVPPATKLAEDEATSTTQLRLFQA
jgi:hypothetical protein